MTTDLRTIVERLSVPLVAAPMLRVSGLDLATAACQAGIIGAFPTVNARGVATLDRWLASLDDTQRSTAGVACPNLIMRAPDVHEHVDVITDHDVSVVITSVGSPAPVIDRLHRAGTSVLADVASVRHAQRAIDAGADGLVLLTAGAGGQTGWLNPFAFAEAIRPHFDGVLTIAGGMSSGRSIWAATQVGYDLAYMGTRFIATTESLAPTEYRQMLVDASMDDIVETKAFTGLRTNMLVPSIERAGLRVDELDETITPDLAGRLFGDAAPSDGPRRWSDIWSAGHSVSGVDRVQPVASLVATVVDEFRAASAASSYPSDITQDSTAT